MFYSNIPTNTHSDSGYKEAMSQHKPSPQCPRGRGLLGAPLDTSTEQTPGHDWSRHQTWLVQVCASMRQYINCPHLARVRHEHAQ